MTSTCQAGGEDVDRVIGSHGVRSEALGVCLMEFRSVSSLRMLKVEEGNAWRGRCCLLLNLLTRSLDYKAAIVSLDQGHRLEALQQFSRLH